MPGPAAVQPGSLGRVRRYGAVRAIAAAVVAVGLAAGALALGVAPALAVPAHALSSSIGSVGSSAGQMELAASSEVAVNDQTGDIYVADTGNHRVDEFDPSKPKAEQFIRAFGANVGGAGIDVCTTTCVKGTSGTAPGAFQEPTLITIDNSSGSSKGDVYVGDTGDSMITKLTGEGAVVTSWGQEGQKGGFTSHEKGKLAGISTAPPGSPVEGDLFAVETFEFTFWSEPDGSEHTNHFFTGLVETPALAVDTEDLLYELRGEDGGTVQVYDTAGNLVGFEMGGDKRAIDVAIDSSNNDLYLTQRAEAGEGGDVQRYAAICHSNCTPIEEFAFESGELKAPQGLAVDATTHTVYIADSSTNQIEVYTLQEVPPPTPTPPQASEVSYTTAKVSGEVNPNGHLTSCRFEYALEASFKDAKSTPCATNPGNGTSPVTVEAQLTGLRGSAEYHVRLLAENRGIPANTTRSGVQTLQTLVVAPPTIKIEPVSAITSTSAHFAGHISPNAPVGDPAAFDVNWEFQCSPACPSLSGGAVAADSSSHEVSVNASDLQPGQPYEVVLIGTNANEVPVTDTEGPVPFTTPAVAPSVISSSVTAASGTEATLSSQVDPGGAPTGYRYEYITEAQYDTDGASFGEGMLSTPQTGPLGSPGDNQEHEASATITSLSANTNYRFRVVVQNDVETVDGPVELLFTHSPEGSTGCANEALRIENDSQLLPDCRAYEQISPADNAEAFVPFGQNVEAEGLVNTEWPTQASAQGDTLAYVAEPPSSGAGEGTGNAGSGEGDEQLARRTGEGWSVSDIQPLASSAETRYEAFSEALTLGVLKTGPDEELSSGTPGHCDQLYSRAGTSAFTALFPAVGSGNCPKPTNFFVGGSSDYSQIAFESKEALAEGATASSGELGHENIYLSSAGSVRTVNVLPGFAPAPEPNATIGGLSAEPSILAGGGAQLPAVNASHAVAANGAAIFWTNLTGANGVIYTRMNPSQEQSEIAGGKCTEPELACTLQVSAGAATYQTATPDGRYAYYTEAGKLWRYDTRSESREELASAGVQGVIGVNESGEDGAYLYFVAAGKLAIGAEARKCEVAPEGSLREEEEGKAPAGYGCNVYLIHEGQTKLVAVLSASDDEFKGNTFGTPQPKKGDWRPVLGYRSAELSADGQSLVFMSGRQLSGYQNINRHGECSGVGQHSVHSCVEVYVFNAQSAKIACASCAPSGAPPVKAKDTFNLEGRATYLPGDFGSITHQRRLISADGDRVFFNSDQPLSPQDKNEVQDVYEWEQEGEGEEGRCAKGSASNGSGCVYLLSGGASGSSGSYLLDTDETGNNAFFVSRTSFVPGGGNGEKPNVFDARVNGGFKGAPGGIIQPEECKSAEECKPPPGEPPVESFPASAAFSGAGNLTAPLEVLKPPAEKPAVRKLTRAQELAKALRACAKEKAKAKRQQCEKQARKKYGPVKKHATKKAKQKGKR
jgi:hypothetical protein